MLKILGRPNSIHVRKLLWYCDELELEYEREDWGRGVRETAVPEYLELNPTAQIPTLIDPANDDFVLWESSAILRYISDEHGPESHDWYPRNTMRRALVDQWLDWCSTDVAYHTKVVAQANFRGVDHFGAEVVRRSEEELDRLADLFAEAIAKSASGYIADELISIADISCGLHANRWSIMRDGARNNEAIQNYLNLLLQRPVFRKYGGPDNV